jgi:hypothetical protein
MLSGQVSTVLQTLVHVMRDQLYACFLVMEAAVHVLLQCLLLISSGSVRQLLTMALVQPGTTRMNAALNICSHTHLSSNLCVIKRSQVYVQHLPMTYPICTNDPVCPSTALSLDG